MTEQQTSTSKRSSYMDGTPLEREVRVDLVINDQAEVLIFHNKPFTRQISWIEYDLDTNKVSFIMNDGDSRNFGILVKEGMEKYLKNTYQILVVLMDDKTGEPVEGEYYPLIIHRA